MVAQKKVDRKAFGYETAIPATLFVTGNLDYSQVGTEAEQIICMVRDYHQCILHYQEIQLHPFEAAKLLDYWLVYHAHVILKIDIYRKHGDDPAV